MEAGDLVRADGSEVMGKGRRGVGGSSGSGMDMRVRMERVEVWDGGPIVCD